MGIDLRDSVADSKEPVSSLTLNVLSTAVSTALLTTIGGSVTAYAQEDSKDDEAENENALEEVVVTASRRAETVQDIPYNISAVTGDQLEKQRITDLTEFVRQIPGLHMADNGVRGPSQLVMRGLNVDAASASEGIDANSTVATYIGETPLFVDLKMVDMNRIEVLRGPQGTLYGSGSLAGAIRYIPNKPVVGEYEFEFDSKVYSTASSSGLSTDANIIFNVPLGDTMAFRGVYSNLSEKGFIDNPYLVTQPGVSNPDVDADLMRKDDVNTEETTQMRLSFLWDVTDSVEVLMTYTDHDTVGGARQVSHYRSQTKPTGQYESAQRYLEPNDRETTLLTLEVQADVGFADLVYSHSKSEFDELGQRDQTDLLLRFEYGYEDFPSFSAFTRETDHEETTTDEIRLVSKSEDSRFNWIVGYFKTEETGVSSSREFTPNFFDFIGEDRPDDLEYIQLNDDIAEETAFYGELGYDISDDWQVTVGIRRFEFQDTIRGGFGLPVWDGLPPSDEIVIEDLLGPNDGSGTSDLEDTFYKLNTSYHVNDDLMFYFTRSEGFRRGGANAVRPCVDSDFQAGQSLCGLPNELSYNADTTINYEIGMHSAWNDNRVTFNAAVFFIDWEGVQVGSSTENGALPITENGNDAESSGIEMELTTLLTDRLTMRAGYSFTDAKLTQDAPQLDSTSFSAVPALAGASLPLAPQHLAGLSLEYNIPLDSGVELDFLYNASYQSGAYTNLRNTNGTIIEDGDHLSGFSLHNVSMGFSKEAWSIGLFINNLGNKYAETNARNAVGNDAFVGAANVVGVRRHFRYVVRPRTMGVSFSYDFQ